MKKTTIERIYHPWWKWECYKAGFFNTTPPAGVDKTKAMEMYAEFLSDLGKFAKGMERVFNEWPRSCEQFLSNPSMNRIAWLGQAAMCIETGIPACFRGGFKLLNVSQQDAANELAKEYLERWLKNEYEEKAS